MSENRIEVDIEFVSNLQKLLADANNQAKKLGDTLGKDTTEKLKEVEEHTSKISEMFKAISLEKLAEKGIEMIKEGAKFVVESTVKWEKNRQIMKSFYQDNIESEMKMRELEEAGHQAYDIDELTKGYVNLRNAGINPAKEEITRFADIAKSQGKSFEGFTGAVQHAMVGRYKSLLEYGIKIKENNGKLETSFRGQKETIGATHADLEKYLNKIAEMPGIAGAAADSMNTVGGAMDGIGRSIEGLATAIGEHFTGEGGIFTKTLKSFKQWIDDIKHVAETTEGEMVAKNKKGFQETYEKEYLAGLSDVRGEAQRKEAMQKMLGFDPKFAEYLDKNNGDVRKAYEERMKDLGELNTRADQRDKYNALKYQIEEQTTKERTFKGQDLTSKYYSEQVSDIFKKSGVMKEGEQFSQATLNKEYNNLNKSNYTPEEKEMITEAYDNLNKLADMQFQLQQMEKKGFSKAEIEDKKKQIEASSTDKLGGKIKPSNTIKELSINMDFKEKSIYVSATGVEGTGKEIRETIANEIHKVFVNVASAAKSDYTD